MIKKFQKYLLNRMLRLAQYGIMVGEKKIAKIEAEIAYFEKKIDFAKSELKRFV
jgi:hypothetical protein